MFTENISLMMEKIPWIPTGGFGMTQIFDDLPKIRLTMTVVLVSCSVSS